MKIGLRIGHSPNCQGANGIINEYIEQRRFYNYLWVILAKYGHTVVDCNSSANTQNGELSEGVRKANDNNVELFISLHMNSGGGQGVEMWTYSADSRANGHAIRMCKAVSDFLKIPNRGVKYNSSYYEMRHIKAPNIISEMCFVDTSDANKWKVADLEGLAWEYAHAIDTRIPNKKPSNETDTSGYYWIVTNVLPKGYKGDGNPSGANDGLDGIDLEYVIPYFLGVRCYIRANTKGEQWIETQNLSYAKCMEIKKSIGSWFKEMKKA